MIHPLRLQSVMYKGGDETNRPVQKREFQLFFDNLRGRPFDRMTRTAEGLHLSRSVRMPRETRGPSQFADQVLASRGNGMRK